MADGRSSKLVTVALCRICNWRNHTQWGKRKSKAKRLQLEERRDGAGMREEAGANVGGAPQTQGGPDNSQPTTHKSRRPRTKDETVRQRGAERRPVHYSFGNILRWPDLWLLSSCGDNIQRRPGMQEGVSRSPLPDEM